MTLVESCPVLKEVKPVNFLYFRTEAYVHQLENFLPVARDLYKEAADHQLLVTGPVQWHYFGFVGDASKPFTLEIALPVSEVIAGYDGSFHFKRTDIFKCVSLIHEGPWHELPSSYQRMMQFIQEENLVALGINREIYINTDFEHPDANITEVQIAIAEPKNHNQL